MNFPVLLYASQIPPALGRNKRRYTMYIFKNELVETGVCIIVASRFAVVVVGGTPTTAVCPGWWSSASDN